MSLTKLFPTTSFHSLLEKCTTPLMEPPSILQQLQIADEIKSKAVTQKEAMRALKKKIGERKPQQQVLALQLTDICVKNGGAHFIAEIASREFMDDLVSLLNHPNGLMTEVRDLMLKLIQSWALSFKSKPELSYVTEVYNNLKRQGMKFPDTERDGIFLIDTLVAPEWSESDYCMRCRSSFTFVNRKHHCRACGLCFDQACSAKTAAIPEYGITAEVRVCDTCYAKRNNGPSNSNDAAAGLQDNEDDDLKKAIAESLREQNGGKAVKQVKFETPPAHDDDPDLAAAIAASLAETQKQPKTKQPTSAYPDLQAQSSMYPTLHSDDRPLAKAPMQNPFKAQAYPDPALNTHRSEPSQGTSRSSTEQPYARERAFIDQIAKIEREGRQSDILNDRSTQDMFEHIARNGGLQNDLSDISKQHEKHLLAHQKLSNALKSYDGYMESRVGQTSIKYQGQPSYNNPPPINYASHPPPHQPTMHPGSHWQGEHQSAQAPYPSSTQQYNGPEAVAPYAPSPSWHEGSNNSSYDQSVPYPQGAAPWSYPPAADHSYPAPSSHGGYAQPSYPPSHSSHYPPYSGPSYSAPTPAGPGQAPYSYPDPQSHHQPPPQQYQQNYSQHPSTVSYHQPSQPAYPPSTNTAPPPQPPHQSASPERAPSPEKALIEL